MDGGTLPGVLELTGEMEMPAGAIPGKGASIAKDDQLTVGLRDLVDLGQIDAAPLAEVLVEQLVDLGHQGGGFPFAGAAIAGLPGGEVVAAGGRVGHRHAVQASPFSRRDAVR